MKSRDFSKKFDETFYEAWISLNSAAARNEYKLFTPAVHDVAETSKTCLYFGVWKSLPGNTVTNPKEDLKGITTRSGVTIQGPKAVNHDAEVTKDTMPPANNGSTEDVQPPDPDGDILLLDSNFETVEPPPPSQIKNNILPGDRKELNSVKLKY
ncbi:hypothetical protein Tco_0915636 [Tanacetum coccineum]